MSVKIKLKTADGVTSDTVRIYKYLPPMIYTYMFTVAEAESVDDTTFDIDSTTMGRKVYEYKGVKGDDDIYIYEEIL